MSDLADLFPGFDAVNLDGAAGRIFARVGGAGPPLLLLHGFPQTHVMWHRVAPALAERFRVVAMDLRGYGWSAAPRPDAAHEAYSKRAMGADAVAVMEALGHARFAIAGHDRGARAAYRLALDHPGRVERLALLDILPTIEAWRRIEAGLAPAAHWGFLSEPTPGPEEAILRDPRAYYEGLLAKWTAAGTLEAFDPRALAHYRAAFGVPERVRAMCEDYRAGATLDRAADEADLAAGRRLACPVLVLSGRYYLTSGAGLEPALDAWRRTFAPGAVGTIAEGGHFVAEENPAATLAALLPFLAGEPLPGGGPA